MEYIQIPLADFSFEAIVKHKAKKIIETYINLGAIIHPYIVQKGKIEQIVAENLLELATKTDKVIFLNEIILHVSKLKVDYNDTKTFPTQRGAQIIAIKEHEEKLLSFDKISFFLYNQLIILGFDIRKDKFTSNEVNDLDSKINSILEVLSKLQAGQEVIFDHIDELKDDFISLKSDYPLGKKRWYQRAGGIALSYFSTKITDEALIY